MQTMLINLKKGDYFTLKDIEEPKESQVFTKGDYNRSTKKFNCAKFSDCLRDFREFKADRLIYIDFTF